MRFRLTRPVARRWFVCSIVCLWLFLPDASAAAAESREFPRIELDLSDPSSFDLLSEPFGLDRGEPLPDELLLGLAARSQSHESTLEEFTCTETLVKEGGSVPT